MDTSCGVLVVLAIAVVLPLWLVLHDPVNDPQKDKRPQITAARVPTTTPSVRGTTPVDAARLTAAATRYQADKAAAAAEQAARIQQTATERAARTQAFVTDRTGRRAALLATLAGAIALLSAWLGWQTHRETVRRNQREADDALTERRDARYTTAITHLTDPGSAAARAAGVYALEDLVHSDPDRRLPILQTLIAFLSERQSDTTV